MADAPIRLLFDENLSRRLVSALAGSYPGSLHIGDAGLVEATDAQIWNHAERHELVIVTKDQDFARLSILLGPQPKVVWIRLGNCTTDDVARLLATEREVVGAFVGHEKAGFLPLP